MSLRRFHAAIATSICAIALTGCAESRQPLVFSQVRSGFTGHTGDRQSIRSFDVVAADMDADGDDDVLLNWHHLAPIELFENRSGRFRLFNSAARDRSGVFDNPHIPSLYAPSSRVRQLIADIPSPALCVWHAADRRDGSWHFVWKSPEPGSGLSLDITTTLPVKSVKGFRRTEAERKERGLTLTFDKPAASREFQVQTGPGTHLQLVATAATGDALPIFVGRTLTPYPSGEVTVWRNDPHGVAWLDIEGSAVPELYMTRGGLMGQLKPPLPAKRDQLFTEGDADTLYHLPEHSPVPADYGRGRRVEWVDVDVDGALEMSVSNKSTPNKVLRRDETGTYVDIAADLGLDLQHGEVQCWGDFDGNGRDDLYYVEDSETGGVIHVLRNRPGGFESIDGASLGLSFGPSAPAESLFNFAALRLADADNDGDLDLWLLMHGDARKNFLFLRDGERFRDASSESGANHLSGSIFTVLFDADNDGLEDVFSAGKPATPGEGVPPNAFVWRNTGGRFEFEALGPDIVPKPVHCATDLDCDGDGRADLVAIGGGRHLLRNLTPETNGHATISARIGGRPAVGAVVRAHYDDGSVCARRVGSAHNSAYSQVVRPLHFGVRAGRSISRLTIHWPGEAKPTGYPAPAGAHSIIDR